MSTATLTSHVADLSPEAVELLRAGAADGLGLCCSPGKVEKNYAALREAERAGYLRFLNIEQPWITDAGRAAIGAPSEAQFDRARVLEAFSPRKPPLVPAKRDDPRTDFDYRSYRACGYACTLAVRQPDRRCDPSTIRVGRSLKSEPQFLGPNNSIILPESDASFVLAVMPGWLVKRAGLSTSPLPLDEAEWNAEQRATWDRLRQICHSVNSRIRNAGRAGPQKLRFGEFA